MEKKMEMSCTLKNVDFYDFLKLVSNEEVDSKATVVEFNSLTKNHDPRRNEGQDVAQYIRLEAPMVYGDMVDVLRISLLHQAKTERLASPIENMVTEHAVEFGLPTHLVKIDDRNQMVANPEDFKVMYDTEGAYALLPLALVRTKLYPIVGQE